MILSNEKFDLTAPRLVFRWAASRLGIYFGAAIAGLILFYAGAAFYSFVWPAPPVAVPVTPTFQPATDPVRGIEKFFDPKNAEPVLVSQLSLDQIKKLL